MPFSFINFTNQKMWNDTKIILKTIMKEAILLKEIKSKTRVNVVLVHDDAMHEFNLHYKGKDYPTDVLTFVSDEEDSLADIIINVDACVRQAQEYEHSVQREFAFLFAHGLLHACGYDHDNEENESKMIQRQKELLREYPRDLKESSL